MPWILARVDAQPGDHLVDRFTFAMGLELNEYTTVVERTEATARRSHLGNGGIPHDGIFVAGKPPCRRA
jgi:hypothetical protein